MSRPSVKKGGNVVNTQVSPRSNETLKLLKRKYKKNSIPAVLDAVLQRCEPAAFEAALEKMKRDEEIEVRLEEDDNP